LDDEETTKAQREMGVMAEILSRVSNDVDESFIDEED